MRCLLVLALFCAAVAGAPSSKIVGGSVTTIDNYPSTVTLLWSRNLVTYNHDCSGIIINSRSILSAAFCTHTAPINHRIRVGSTYANSGGVVHTVSAIVNHPQYNLWVYRNNDISILKTPSDIVFNNNVQNAFFAGPYYNLPDNSEVWAAGWGYSELGSSEQLRHVQIRTVNQEICRQNYVSVGFVINDNMLCAGNLGVIGYGQCWADCGGPLYHNGVVVGVSSFLLDNLCGSPLYPSIYTRVSKYIVWIQQNV